MPALRFRLLLLMTAVAATLVGQAPPKQSPFEMRKNGAAPGNTTPAPPVDAVLEFSGIMKIGRTTMVCITTVTDKRTRWIKVGESSDGIQVPDQPAPTNSVLVRHAGREVTLPFKQPTYDAAAIAASYQMGAMPEGPAPQAGVAPTVALTNEEKETEARMLVSDLLEIGMIQRKAYQEAKAQELAEKRAEAEATRNEAAAQRTAPR